MIITLTKADFSNNNIGKLNSWFISAPTVVGGVVTADVNNPSSIDKESKPAVTLKYTFDTTKYEYVNCTPSVGTASCSGNTITVSIPSGATIVANVTISIVLNRIGGGEEPETPMYTMLSEREYPDTNVDINATSKAGDSLEMIAKFTYGRQADPVGKKQILCGSNMGVLMMINPETKVMTNNTTSGTYALTEGSEYYMKIKLVPSGNKSVMTSTVYNGTDTTMSTPLDTITRDITNTDPYPLYVGSSQITSATTLAATMNSGIKIKEFWVYKPSGTLIFNGVPAKRNSDNAYGLYDSVTQRFFAEQKIVIS